MITLALFEQMADDGVGGLTRNTDFFWEELPLQSNGKPASGVWLITRGGDASRSPKGLNLKTTVDFYVAFANKVKAEKVQRAILDYFIANSCFCELAGSVGDVAYNFDNVRVRATTTPQNDGVTENGLIVKMASYQLVYDINNNERTNNGN